MSLHSRRSRGLTLITGLATRVLQSAPSVTSIEKLWYSISQGTHNKFGNEAITPSQTSMTIPENDSLEEILADLRSDIQCLFDLDPLYEDPVSDVEDDPCSGSLESPPSLKPEQLYIDRIHYQFPLATTELVLQLGLHNWKRFLRGQAQREDHGYLSQGKQMDDEQKEKVGTLVQSKPHDSGLESASPSLSSSGETVRYFLQLDSTRTRILPLPEGGKRGLPFECPVCGRMVSISNTRSWK
jgi:hypothetical protein